MMPEYLVLFGSNIEADEHLAAALRALGGEAKVEIVDVSPVYESPAVLASGEVDLGRPLYRNAAILLWSPMDGESLQRTLRRIEADLGRIRVEDKYADRSVDLDILATNGEEGVEADAALWEYAYAAVPAADVAPGWKAGPNGLSLAELADGLRHNNAQIRRT